MRYTYDDEKDVLFIRFREGNYHESEEIYDGFVIDFDETGRPLAIDIFKEASKFVDIDLLKRNVEEKTFDEDLPRVDKESRVQMVADAAPPKKKGKRF